MYVFLIQTVSSTIKITKNSKFCHIILIGYLFLVSAHPPKTFVWFKIWISFIKTDCRSSWAFFNCSINKNNSTKFLTEHRTKNLVKVSVCFLLKKTCLDTVFNERIKYKKPMLSTMDKKDHHVILQGIKQKVKKEVKWGIQR